MTKKQTRFIMIALKKLHLAAHKWRIVNEFGEKWERLFFISRSVYVELENWTIREEFENHNKFNFSKISTKLRENSVS